MLETDFTRMPDPGDEVFTAPLKKPAQVGEDWLEPAQRAYTAEENAIWDELFTIVPSERFGSSHPTSSRSFFFPTEASREEWFSFVRERRRFAAPARSRSPLGGLRLAYWHRRS